MRSLLPAEMDTGWPLLGPRKDGVDSFALFHSYFMSPPGMCPYPRTITVVLLLPLQFHFAAFPHFDSHCSSLPVRTIKLYQGEDPAISQCFSAPKPGSLWITTDGIQWQPAALKGCQMVLPCPHSPL